MGFFSLHHRVHPASYPMDTGALTTGIKQPGREADYSAPNSWRHSSTAPIFLHGVVLN